MKTLVRHLIPNAGTLIIVGLLFLAQSVGALPDATPASTLAPSQTLISYQGMLTDPLGNPINGMVPMEFAFYDASTGGTLLWGPETQSVEVNDGLLQVLLGSMQPIDWTYLSGDVFLELVVDGETLAPREVLTSVAYAIEASTLPDGATTRGSLELSGNLDMTGRSVINTRNVLGEGTQKIHMPAPGDSIYMNWGSGDSVFFGGGDTVADVSIRPTGINMHGNTVTNCGALTEANLQTKEELAAERIDRFEEGDVLCWSSQDQRLEKCATANDPLVQAVADTEGRPIVIGAEPVKVIGPVHAGDYLVASGVPGYAMAVPNPTFGTVIAQALEDFDGDQGIIKAMIRKM